MQAIAGGYGQKTQQSMAQKGTKTTNRRFPNSYLQSIVFSFKEIAATTDITTLEKLLAKVKATKKNYFPTHSSPVLFRSIAQYFYSKLF